jgi:hypothetical protein
VFKRETADSRELLSRGIGDPITTRTKKETTHTHSNNRVRRENGPVGI